MMTFLLAVLIATASLAQRPDRDAFHPLKGSGRIRGTVTASDNGLPIRRASVRLSASDLVTTLTATTDSAGRFEFDELLPARYTIVANKGGFVQPSHSVDKGYEGDGVRTLDLKDGQRVDSVRIALPRGGVLTGRVLDEFGDPIPEAYVEVFRASYEHGVRRLRSVRRTAANDIGQYRIYGLSRGTYYVSGTIRATDPILFGDAPPQRPQQPGRTGFAPVFYPGSLSASNALPIKVDVGQQIANLDFALQAVRLARMSGAVVDSRGRPARGTVLLVGARPDGVLLESALVSTIEDGRFAIAGIGPGEYFLYVMAKVGLQGAETSESAGIPLTVVGDEIEGLAVATSPGHSLSGRVVFDGEGPAPRTHLKLTAYDVTTGASVPGLMLMDSAPVNGDGTFEIRNARRTRIIRADGVPERWALKAVRTDGIDVIDSGLELRGADVSNVEVVFGPASEIAGAVTDARGAPVANRTVAIFPVDRSRRTGFMNRYVTSARVGADGTFKISAMPAGTYFAAVLQNAADDEWAAPENLEGLEATATKFMLAEGEKRTLRLIRDQ